MIIGGIEIDFKPEFGNTKHMRALAQMNAQAAKISRLQARKDVRSGAQIQRQINEARGEIIRIANTAK